MNFLDMGVFFRKLDSNDQASASYYLSMSDLEGAMYSKSWHSRVIFVKHMGNLFNEKISLQNQNFSWFVMLFMSAKSHIQLIEA
jgi:hypothetical protein